jgi:hypothetical protein
LQQYSSTLAEKHAAQHNRQDLEHASAAAADWHTPQHDNTALLQHNLMIMLPGIPRILQLSITEHLWGRALPLA